MFRYIYKKFTFEQHSLKYTPFLIISIHTRRQRGASLCRPQCLAACHRPACHLARLPPAGRQPTTVPPTAVVAWMKRRLDHDTALAASDARVRLAEMKRTLDYETATALVCGRIRVCYPVIILKQIVVTGEIKLSRVICVYMSTTPASISTSRAIVCCSISRSN